MVFTHKYKIDFTKSASHLVLSDNNILEIEVYNYNTDISNFKLVVDSRQHTTFKFSNHITIPKGEFPRAAENEKVVFEFFYDGGFVYLTNFKYY